MIPSVVAILALTFGAAATGQVSGRGDGSTTYVFVSDGDCFTDPFVCDPVGRGDSGIILDPLTIGSRNAYNGVRLDFSTPLDQGNAWFMDFAETDANIELQAGTFNFAVSFDEDPVGIPRFEISRQPGTKCVDVENEYDSSGNFEVTLVEYDQYGDPIRFDGIFDQFCFDFAGVGLHGTSVSYRLNAILGPTTLTEGNILVSFRNRVYEYANPPETPDGPFQPAAASKVVPIRRPPGFPLPGVTPHIDERARDLVLDGQSSLHVFNGTADAKLSTLDLATGVWRNDTLAGLDVAGQPAGDVAVWGDSVFVTDTVGPDNGIVVFDKANNYSATRFALGESYDDMTLGFDGLLYAAKASGVETTVDIYDPDTQALLGSVMLDTTTVSPGSQQAIYAIAVNARGEIFGGARSSNGPLFRFDTNGSAVDKLSVTYLTFFNDIALSRSGQIVIGDALRGLALTDESLNSSTAYFLDFTGPGSYVAWVEPGVVGLQLDDFETGDLSLWDAASGDYAGIIESDPAAAKNGTYGLRVDVGSICTDPVDNVVPGPTATGLFLGCNSVTTNTPVEIIDPGATFASGQIITLDNDLQISSDFGAVLDDGFNTRFGWVEDHLPTPGSSHNAEFELNLDSLTLDPADDVVLFAGMGDSGEEEFRATLIRNGAMNENRLVLAARLDDGTYAETPFGEQILLQPGWKTLRFLWRAANGFGYFLLSVDGIGFVGLSDLDNDTRTVSEVRLGAIRGTVGGASSGSLWLDDYDSWQ